LNPYPKEYLIYVQVAPSADAGGFHLRIFCEIPMNDHDIDGMEDFYELPT